MMRPFFLNSGLTGLYNLLLEKRIAVTGIVYLLFCVCILYRYGINTNGEAMKYIEDAQHILNGQELRIEFFSVFYVVYSLIISFFIYFSLGLQGVAIVQILFSFAAGCCIYKILADVTGDKKTGYAGLIFYLGCFPLQKWNFFLYTESLHTSFTVAGLYFFYCILYKGQVERWWGYAILLLLIIFSRPVGIIFLLAALITWFTWLIRKRKKIIYYPVIIGFVILAIFLLQSPFVFYLNPDSLRRMEVICQVPQTNSPVDYKEYNNSGLRAFFHIIFYEIGFKNFFLTGIKKVAYFFSMIRGFYSLRQNIILLLTGLLLYPFAMAGIFFFRNEKGSFLQIFNVSYIFLTAAGIFFTCDEWSNRFIAPVLPHLIILAGLGLFYSKNKFKKFQGR
jgi:4-amino-4-deoxy-L-arabinose transferase-like glycosyltransferase